MKKFERNVEQNFNLKEEVAKRLELTADDIANLSAEDILDNVELVGAQLQVSEKDLADLLANPNITSLEEAIKQYKDFLSLNLNALTTEDVSEEIVFSGTTKLDAKADKMHVLKQKDKVWYELAPNFTSTQLLTLAESYPELAIGILVKALPKLTATELKSFRTALNNAETAGLLIKKTDTTIVRTTTTKQLSLEDLENINE
jgi:hypothetical protein